MSIEIFSGGEVDGLRRAGRVAAATLDRVQAELRAGMSTADINAIVIADTAERGGTPSQLGYHGFTGAVCTSRNEVVCHGVPDAREVVVDGDIINVDVTTGIGGFHGDTSRTLLIGDVSAEARFVVDVAQRCLYAGIAVVRHGASLGDIGAAILELARKQGCSVVRDFGGHGIGRTMHADPHVPHTGLKGRGLRLVKGMCITIEPMINLGTADVKVLADGWRVVTADGRLSAQFEHTILVTTDGAEILTPSSLAPTMLRPVT